MEGFYEPVLRAVSATEDTPVSKVCYKSNPLDVGDPLDVGFLYSICMEWTKVVFHLTWMLFRSKVKVGTSNNKEGSSNKKIQFIQFITSILINRLLAVSTSTKICGPNYTTQAKTVRSMPNFCTRYVESC